MNFTQWITEQYQRIADSYRTSLYMEVEHTKLIYGRNLPDDVRIMLHKALHEIKPPVMDKWLGDRTGTMEIYNKLQKPNYAAILQEVLDTL